MTRLNRVNNTENSELKLSQKLALGSGFFCLLFLEKACEILAIPFYQMTLGVDPFLFSITLTIPIIFSAFLAPWVGKLSDNCTSKFGRRRPFIFVSAWLSASLFGLMWMVPEHWSTDNQLLYFFVISLLFYAAASFYSVPLTSLSYEITKDAHQRIKVMETNSYFIKLASMSNQWLYPLATLTIFSSTFVGIKAVGWFTAIFVIGIIGMLPALYVKENSVEPINHPHNNFTVVENVKSIMQSHLMRLVFVIIFIQLGIGAYAAKMDYYVLVYYMFDGNISDGAVWKAVLSMGYAIIAAIYIPIVSWFSRRIGKLATLKIIFIMTAIGGGAKWFIYTPGVQWLILLDPILCSAIWTSMTIIIPALVAQASDQDHQTHKISRQGGFASVYQWVVALSIIFALLASGMSLNIIGFDASLANAQSSNALLSMKLILSLGTIIPSMLAVFLLNKYQKSHKDT
ncbi:MFS transporter [Thalassotalea nanhaiensis]|uniref:MFS transporter n=1 Tax=Thalassotalea nanhaiensis TaxID=3065648 RepID=A0ABY9TK09_9GAMM|nr:MFS transporter [Colwelliaceae bacterium SQ345]